MGNVQSARPLHPPAEATIIFNHRKFDGCWRDPLGHRLRCRSNSDLARTFCGSRNFPLKVGLPDIFHLLNVGESDG
jgi:hypothetical protein